MQYRRAAVAVIIVHGLAGILLLVAAFTDAWRLRTRGDCKHRIGGRSQTLCKGNQCFSRRRGERHYRGGKEDRIYLGERITRKALPERFFSYDKETLFSAQVLGVVGFFAGHLLLASAAGAVSVILM